MVVGGRVPGAVVWACRTGRLRACPGGASRSQAGYPSLDVNVGRIGQPDLSPHWGDVRANDAGVALTCRGLARLARPDQPVFVGEYDRLYAVA